MFAGDDMTPDPELRELTLAVRHKSEIADGVFLFDLRANDNAELPPFTPGAHITVTAPSGQKRRYSLCNDPAERDRYVIAVKQEASGRGGSLSFTREVNEGDQVAAEPPENEFEMAKTAPKRLVFIAGGIGITPIRAMILHCLRHGQTNFMLYYFTRTPSMMAFRGEFASKAFEGKVVLHHDNGDPDQAYDLWPVLEEQRGAHLYCCGPRGLMDAVRDMTGHWPDSAVHFEDFVGASAPRADDRPFGVRTREKRRDLRGRGQRLDPGYAATARPCARQLLRKRHLRHLPLPLCRRRAGSSRSRALRRRKEARDHDLRLAGQIADTDAGYIGEVKVIRWQLRRDELALPACGDVGLLPPERGRVGVGVNLMTQSAGKAAGSGRVTPSRFAPKRKHASQLTDLPLSGGGEESRGYLRILFSLRGEVKADWEQP